MRLESHEGRKATALISVCLIGQVNMVHLKEAQGGESDTVGASSRLGLL